MKIAGGASKGKRSRTNGGPADTFEADQVTVNGLHWVGLEYDVEKATVGAKAKAKAKAEREKERREGSITLVPGEPVS